MPKILYNALYIKSILGILLCRISHGSFLTVGHEEKKARSAYFYVMGYIVVCTVSYCSSHFGVPIKKMAANKTVSKMTEIAPKCQKLPLRMDEHS